MPVHPLLEADRQGRGVVRRLRLRRLWGQLTQVQQQWAIWGHFMIAIILGDFRQFLHENQYSIILFCICMYKRGWILRQKVYAHVFFLHFLAKIISNLYHRPTGVSKHSADFSHNFFPRNIPRNFYPLKGRRKWKFSAKKLHMYPGTYGMFVPKYSQVVQEGTPRDLHQDWKWPRIRPKLWWVLTLKR
jgi:hypothetical protein